MPPSACSNRPVRVIIAPVKLPFSWPNSSLSIRFGGTAPQSNTTSSLRERGDRLWMVCATTSLPVPVSPSMMTVVAVGAIFSTIE